MQLTIVSSEILHITNVSYECVSKLDFVSLPQNRRSLKEAWYNLYCSAIHISSDSQSRCVEFGPDHDSQGSAG